MEEEKLPRRSLRPEEIRTFNNGVVYAVSRFLNLAPDAIRIEDVKQIHRDCGVSMDYAYALLLGGRLGMDTEGKDRDLFRNYFLPMIHYLDVDDYTANPYYRSIRIPEARDGRWELKTMELKPAEGFVCRDFRVFPDGRLVPQIGFFDRPFPYPAVLENGREWMTLLPNETVTTDPAVGKAHGHVLTFGLGLGYFVFSALRNPDVKDVTVVELSPDVIRLFRTHILPQFPDPDRVHIIQSDAFSYLDRQMKPGMYDFVFADIWHDVGDGKELYLKMKTYEDRYKGTVFTYWLEDSIRCYLDPGLWPDPPKEA